MKKPNKTLLLGIFIGLLSSYFVCCLQENLRLVSRTGSLTGTPDLISLYRHAGLAQFRTCASKVHSFSSAVDARDEQLLRSATLALLLDGDCSVQLLAYSDSEKPLPPMPFYSEVATVAGVHDLGLLLRTEGRLALWLVQESNPHSYAPELFTQDYCDYSPDGFHQMVKGFWRSNLGVD